jgi:hypothetical protein
VAVRRPRLIPAAIDTAFVVAAGALGWFKAPVWALVLVMAAMIGYWAWTRRAALRRQGAANPALLAASAAISLLMIVLFLGVAYAIGGVMVRN